MNSSRLRSLFYWMLRNRDTGEITIWQFPNLPIWIWLALTVVNIVFDPQGTAGTVLQVCRAAVLAIWAIMEISTGVNPFRRILGGFVLVFQIVWFIRYVPTGLAVSPNMTVPHTRACSSVG